MKYFVIMSVLLVWLSMCSCAPDDYASLSSPPTEHPEGDDAPAEPIDPSLTSGTMKITVGDTSFTATLAANAAVSAFTERLPLTLLMSDFNDNEKVCTLPNHLPTFASNPDIIQAGDIMLYGSNSLVLFYKTFPTSYRYTKIGRIDTPSVLETVLGLGDVTIKFELK